MAYAAVQFGQVSGNSAAATINLGAAPTPGNLLVCWLLVFAVPTATNGWTLLTVATSGMARTCLAWKVAGASEAPAQNVATFTSVTWATITGEYSGNASSALVDGENSVGLGTNQSTFTTPMVTPTAGVERLTVCAARTGVSPVSFSNSQVAGSATGVTNRGTLDGGGYGMTYWDRIVASTSGSYSGSTQPSNATNNGNSAGIGLFAAAAPAGAQSYSVGEASLVTGRLRRGLAYAARLLAPEGSGRAATCC